MKDTVEFSRAEYVANLDLWRMVSDACAGEAAVKSRGDDYLPKPNPCDKSPEAEARYKGYIQRAVYYNACGRTLSGLVGLAFAKDPTIEAPGKIEYLLEDADGARLPLAQSAACTMSEVLKTGRAGVMVDFPNRDIVATAQDVADGEARATLQFYPAQSIINWRSERIGASLVLTLVVLREIEQKWDEFGMTSDTIYRVLRLQDGVYWQEVWRTDNTDATGKKVYQLDELFIPTDGNGNSWSEIPFAFVGSVSNHADIETHNWVATSVPYTTMSPMYDIAVLNLAHYRNSADFEDSVFLCGQPQPWMNGLDVEWRDKLLSSGITLGSRTLLPLPVNGQFGLAQANPNQLVAEAMKHKEEQMRALGAKLIQPTLGSRTATQANHEASNDNSVLSLVCDNVSAAYAKALSWAAQFMGETGDTDFSIDTQFSVNPLDAQSITAVVQAWQAGAIPATDLWGSLRKMAVIDPQKSDEEISAELAGEQPTAPSAEELAAMTPTQSNSVAEPLTSA